MVPVRVIYTKFASLWPLDRHSKYLCVIRKKLRNMSIRDEAPSETILLNPLPTLNIDEDGDQPSTRAEQKGLIDSKDGCEMITQDSNEETASDMCGENRTADAIAPCLLGTSDQSVSDYEHSGDNIAEMTSNLTSTKISEPVAHPLSHIERKACKKKTILPKSLLDNVTDLVKQQKIKLPQTKSVDEEAGAEMTMPTPIDVLAAKTTDSELDLLFPDLVGCSEDTGQKSDEVYDISPLFTGELDRRYKSEKKKAIKMKGKKLTSTKKRNGRSLKEKGEDEEGEEKKERKPVPNYFVSIQINNKQIHDALRKVQEEVLAGNRLLSHAMVRLAKLHLTLMVLSLENKDEIARSKCALDNIKDKLSSQYSGKILKLNVCGLGNFGNEIVFAKIKEKEQVDELMQIANVVEDCFLNQELVSPDKRGLKPHVTLMKLSKARFLRKKGIKKIDEKLYRKFKETDFGVEDVKTIQLCEMKSGNNRYYRIEHEVQFISAKCPVDDSGYEENIAYVLDQNPEDVITYSESEETSLKDEGTTEKDTGSDQKGESDHLSAEMMTDSNMLVDKSVVLKDQISEDNYVEQGTDTSDRISKAFNVKAAEEKAKKCGNLEEAVSVETDADQTSKRTNIHTEEIVTSNMAKKPVMAEETLSSDKDVELITEIIQASDGATDICGNQSVVHTASEDLNLGQAVDGNKKKPETKSFESMADKPADDKDTVVDKHISDPVVEADAKTVVMEIEKIPKNE